MEKPLLDTLRYLDLSEKEIRFFLANYKLGTATVNEIAHAARLERSTAYLVAQKLTKKGFILEDFKAYRKGLVTIEPEALLRKLAAKKRKIGRHELLLKDKLPELQAIYGAPHFRPRVRSYEGTSGLLSAWSDILSSSEEILLWTNQEREGSIFSPDQHAMFVKERLHKQVPLRALAVHNAKGQLLKDNDRQCLRQTRLLPKSVTFSAETYIYGNKLAILDHNKNIIGIIIESEQIADAQRAIFEMNWSLLEAPAA